MIVLTVQKIREKGGQTLFEFHYGDMKEPITLNVLESIMYPMH